MEKTVSIRSAKRMTSFHTITIVVLALVVDVLVKKTVSIRSAKRMISFHTITVVLAVVLNVLVEKTVSIRSAKIMISSHTITIVVLVVVLGTGAFPIRLGLYCSLRLMSASIRTYKRLAVVLASSHLVSSS